MRLANNHGTQPTNLKNLRCMHSILFEATAIERSQTIDLYSKMDRVSVQYKDFNVHKNFKSLELTTL